MRSVGGRLRSIPPGECGAVHETPPIFNCIANYSLSRTPVGGQFGWGATPSKRYQGRPKVASTRSGIGCRVQGHKAALHGLDQQQSVLRKQGLANHSTSFVGVSDNRKVTPGITELSLARAHIDPEACYFDVVSPYPGGAAAAKGGVVRPLKGIVRWV